VFVRQKLTETEVTLAFIIGGGLTLIILGFTLAAAQAGVATFDPSRLNVMIAIGAILFIVGVAAWLIIVQPWKNFDDWSTPLYTGHDDHHADVHDAATHGEAIAIAAGAETPDNLTTISGITPKINSVLNAVGIYSYAQLAAHNPAEIERIVSDAGLRIKGKAANWVEQAKSAASKPPSSTH
jgi:predicted flap endonuclease-1-like 5' DNA nuclease